jgi:hypothetical protein
MGRNANVFKVVLQRGAKKETLEVNSHEMSIHCRNNTVEQSLTVGRSTIFVLVLLG